MTTSTLLRFLFALCIVPLTLGAQTTAAPSGGNAGGELLIRCDDIGMCHSVNMAVKRVLESGMPISASVMVACPWWQEGIALLKQYPQNAYGIHLTLNSEWMNYRWGPVAGWKSVPSLTDSDGVFFPSRKTFFDNKPRLDEVERELRAQIERGVRSGLRIDYVDYHMGTAVDTPEMRAIVEHLAAEYKLGISRYFGEEDLSGAYAAPVEHKADTLTAHLASLVPGTVRLMVFHIGLDTPEMEALIDQNSFGLKGVGRHRQGELDGLLSPLFRQAIADKHIRLLTYRDLIERVGLANSKRPE